MAIGFNWAVVGAAVAYMVIGMLWYGPLFGKAWARMMRFTPQKMKSMCPGPAKSMSLGFVTALITASVLDHVVALLGASTFGKGAYVGFLMWVGFYATTQLGVFLWEGKPLKLWVLNTAASLVTLLVMGGILAAW